MAEINADLLKQAAELNIEVTESATNEALQAAIDAVLSEDAEEAKAKAKKTRAPAVKMFPYRINRDFWDEKAVRHRKGGIVEMTAEEAQDGLEAGAITRVKD